MYTKQALHELGVTSTAITDEQKRQLDSQGFFIVENALSKGDVKTLREEFERIHATEAEKGTRSLGASASRNRVRGAPRQTAVAAVEKRYDGRCRNGTQSGRRKPWERPVADDVSRVRDRPFQGGFHVETGSGKHVFSGFTGGVSTGGGSGRPACPEPQPDRAATSGRR